jgi:hypothetical protein
MIYFEAAPNDRGGFDVTGGYVADEEFIPGATGVMLSGIATNDAGLGVADVGGSAVDYTQALGRNPEGPVAGSEVSFFGVMDRLDGNVYATDFQMMRR